MRVLFWGWAMLSLVVSSVGVAQADAVKGGEWEITTQMNIPGMPVVIPPVTVRQCVSDKDRVPRPQKQQGNCEISAIKNEGNKVSWTVKCTGQRPMEGSGEVTYSGETMEGKSTFQMKNPHSGQDMTATQTITGKRVGDCKK